MMVTDDTDLAPAEVEDARSLAAIRTSDHNQLTPVLRQNSAHDPQSQTDMSGGVQNTSSKEGPGVPKQVLEDVDSTGDNGADEMLASSKVQEQHGSLEDGEQGRGPVKTGITNQTPPTTSAPLKDIRSCDVDDNYQEGDVTDGCRSR